MPLWGKVDNAANSDIAAVMQVNKSITSANQTSLYKNVTPGDFFPNVAIGQFAADVNEVRANPTIPHAGWVLRKEGTGLRAGRVTYEVLVAGRSIGSPDGTDDTYFPDYRLAIGTQPVSTNGAGNVTLSVVATSTPSGATFTYLWQRNAGGGWLTVANTAGLYFNNTSPTLTANAAVANANTFRVLVSAAGANTVTSANAIVTTP
jgi:hypothetical protein